MTRHPMYPWLKDEQAAFVALVRQLYPTLDIASRDRDGQAITDLWNAEARRKGWTERTLGAVWSRIREVKGCSPTGKKHASRAPTPAPAPPATTMRLPDGTVLEGSVDDVSRLLEALRGKGGAA